jgi:hypothetical protein
MNTTLRLLTLALATAGMPLAGGAAQDPTPEPAYALRHDGGMAGGYPLKKRYADFTPGEKAGLRALYEGMPDTDEPPFPAAGMRAIIDQVAEISGLYKTYGFVSFFVSIDPTGNATGVRVMNAPTNIEATEAIAHVLVNVKYKPGRCAGKPCTMEFPARFNLTL